MAVNVHYNCVVSIFLSYIVFKTFHIDSAFNFNCSEYIEHLHQAPEMRKISMCKVQIVALLVVLSGASLASNKKTDHQVNSTCPTWTNYDPLTESCECGVHVEHTVSCYQLDVFLFVSLTLSVSSAWIIQERSTRFTETADSYTSIICTNADNIPIMFTSVSHLEEVKETLSGY